MPHRPFLTETFRSLVFDAGTTPQIVVDAEQRVVLANSRACALLQLTDDDIGRHLAELQAAGVVLPVRSVIERVTARRSRATERNHRIDDLAGTPTYFDLHATPLTDAADQMLGISILFAEGTPQAAPGAGRSPVEELHATNQELQSTNEALLTINGDLQRVNDELHHTNELMQARAHSLESTNIFLQAVLSSLPEGIVILDCDLCVLAWNRRAEETARLSADDKGQPFLHLDLGFPLLELAQPLGKCLSHRAHCDDVFVVHSSRGSYGPVEIAFSQMVDAVGAEVTGIVLTIKELPAAPRPH